MSKIHHCKYRSLLLGGLLAITPMARAGEEDASSLIARIKSVQGEGTGNVAAGKASRELAQRGLAVLLDVLRGMDGADPVTANWLRASVDTIAERSISAGQPLPVEELEKFVLNRSHAGFARRLAFEWLAKVDTTAPDRLIPGMLNDPGVELRRDAVARVMDDSKKLLDGGDEPAAVAAYQKALAAARDRDQVLEIAKQLESLGQKANLTAHFGCIQHWHLIAPFGNTDKRGFDTIYPPEKKIDLDAEYEGKDSKVRWKDYQTEDRFGVLDLNKVIGKQMGVAAYAFAEIDSPEEQPAQIRTGSPNAIRVWLNGKLVLNREEYHHGVSMDQYQATVKLKPGRNAILIKVCQNEQTEEWAQNWTFQLRVCDLTGGGIGSGTTAPQAGTDRSTKPKDGSPKTQDGTRKEPLDAK